MSKLSRIGIDGITPEDGSPKEENLISGTPTFRSWNVDETASGVFSGIWECTPGKWRFESTRWEYCRILSGVSIITEEGGAAHTVRAGDSFVIRAGFKGTWETVETTRKDYVICP